MWHADRVIELAHGQLDPRDRERWREALSRKAAVARPTWRMEIEPLLFVALLWLAAYLATFGPLTGAVSRWAIDAIRLVSGAAWIAVLVYSERMRRLRESAWPSGRFLFSWGYAEVERDVMRIVPMDELELDVRRRWPVVGRTQLRLCADRWSTDLFVDAPELVAVAALLDHTGRRGLVLAPEGYRDGQPTIDGPRVAPRRVSFRAREAALVAVVSALGVLAPSTLPDDASSPPAAAHALGPEGHPFRRAYVDALGWRPGDARPDVALHLEPCGPSPLVLDTVTTYLRMALDSPRLGPARPFALPFYALRPEPDRFWAECTWEVDPDSGLFRRTEARWGLDRGGVRRIERRAVLSSSDVLGVVTDCAPVAPRLAISPEGLALASSGLAMTTIFHDVMEDWAGPRPSSDAAALLACASEHAARIDVMHVRDP
jgi:hypothetical protein